MATASPLVPPPPPRSPQDVEIKIISHSNLFYWWPVWAVGFLMAMLTFYDDHLMAIVPAKTLWGRGESGEIKLDEAGKKLEIKDRDVLVAPANAKIEQTFLHMANKKSYGVLWAIVLLLVITITNVPLRGMWSVVVIISVVALSIIFALAGWWDNIFYYIDKLRIEINAGGYLFISIVLFAIWLVTFMFFDKQIYMVFTPGQLKVCTEIGGGEKAYDTSGMTVEKQRSDLFRHWILGLGSGDLIVNTSGAGVHQFDLHNVLFVGSKVQQIEDMLRERAVVRGS